MKVARLLGLVVLGLFVLASPAMAQAPSSLSFGGASVGVGLGVAVAILGAGIGFGKIGAAAVESMARQPEIAAKIQTAAIVIGALLEGATFFGLLILLMLQGKATF
jgi:F-type H+-transporting ATPase subunit c